VSICPNHPKGEHKFAKFDDVSVFCTRCTERRIIAPGHAWWGVLPPYPTWYHPIPQYPIYWWSDAGTVTTVSAGTAFSGWTWDSDTQSTLTTGESD
jgi:hypothetical protein